MNDLMEDNQSSLQPKNKAAFGILSARMSGQAPAAGTSASSVKMHILVIAGTKEESEKLKSKIFDFRFSKVSAAYTGLAEGKFPRDVHAIVGQYKTDEEFYKDVAPILETFEKHKIKALFGKKSEGEHLTRFLEQKWELFDDSKTEDLKVFLKKQFDEEVQNIKQIFEGIDEDKNGFLSPFELTIVSEKLGQPMSKDEIQKCVKIIDADGNGEITFDEFALWWISGREGAPSGLGNQLASFMAQSQKFSNLAIRQLNNTLKSTKDLEAKDLRQFSLNFKVGDYKEGQTGITLGTTFGIVDSKQKFLADYKAKLGFADKENWMVMKFHIDDDETQETVLKRISEFKIIKLFERYVKVHNQITGGT